MPMARSPLPATRRRRRCRSAAGNANPISGSFSKDDAALRSFYFQSPAPGIGSMELSKKVKTALDETRMLILEAQILLRFEFVAAFSDGFDQLSGHSRHLEELALTLMVTSVALMITPGPYHRIVEGGRDSGAFHNVTAVIANLSLLPFALALGIDVFVSIERICGSTGALAAGIGAAAVALALWYGMPRVAALRHGPKQ